MVYTNTMTATIYDKRLRKLIILDGDVCYYCKVQGLPAEFVPGHKHLKRTMDHLNRNEQDHRLENLALAHAMCNQKHKDNHTEISVLAQMKLKENVNSDRQSLSEKESEGAQVRAGEKAEPRDTNALKETDINMIVNKITIAYLEEKLPKDSEKEILYSQALRSIHYLTIKETGGRGSEQAVRRAINAQCSEYAPWEEYAAGVGKRLIRRRKEN